MAVRSGKCQDTPTLSLNEVLYPACALILHTEMLNLLQSCPSLDAASNQHPGDTKVSIIYTKSNSIYPPSGQFCRADRLQYLHTRYITFGLLPKLSE